MKIVLFAGTSEGKAAAQALHGAGHQLCVTVATDYGNEVFTEAFAALAGVETIQGRLDLDQMIALISDADLVMDATHPFATIVSDQILNACAQTKKGYVRILRTMQSGDYSAVYVDSPEEAIAYLSAREGNVLLTTGSKDLVRYAQLPNFDERLYPRILPDAESLAIAQSSGYKRSHIICMQGPFTTEVNTAMLRQIKARFLLTKETGASGGFGEKLAACTEAGATAIVIRRPREAVEQSDHADRVGMELGALCDFLQAQEHGKAFDIELLRAYLAKREEQGASAEDKAVKNLSTRAMEAERSEDKPSRFPVFIDLDGARVTVVGAGAIAQRRIAALLPYGAHITVIAPDIDRLHAEFLPKLKASHPECLERLTLLARTYQAGDLSGSVLAIAATDDRSVNHAVYSEAQEQKILATIADCKEESSFYFPALWSGARISMGMVSDGTDHRYLSRMAKKIRALLEEHIEEQDETN